MVLGSAIIGYFDPLSKPDRQRRPTKAEGIALVFLGSFNPAIFQPEWFMRHGLIADKQDSLQLEAVTNDVAAWSHGWLKGR